MRELQILQDVTSDLQIENPQVNVRSIGTRLGPRLSAEQIERRSSAMPPRQVTTIFAPNNPYHVILELSGVQTDPAALSMLYVRSQPPSWCRCTVSKLSPAWGRSS